MEYNNVPNLSELVDDMVNISQNQRQNGQTINIDHLSSIFYDELNRVLKLDRFDPIRIQTFYLYYHQDWYQKFYDMDNTKFLSFPFSSEIQLLFYRIRKETNDNKYHAYFWPYYNIKIICFIIQMKLLTDFFQIKSDNKIPENPKSKNGSPTDQQIKVINAPLECNLSIIACAGSGKTTTLINRISFLIQNGVHPSSIILTTFTRDAAKDMTKKLEKKLGKENGVYVGTMDSLSLYFLKKFDALSEEMKNVGEYASNFLEFLQTHDNRNIFFSNKKYLFVDEFQDINQLQYNIINEFYKNKVFIIGVGDDAQNIYTFRGSDVKYIIDFRKYFDSEQHYLTYNFRSTEEIVKVANEVIERAHYCIPKKMISQDGYRGDKPMVRFFNNAEDQSDFILGKIQELRRNFPLDEICILAPINQMLYKLEEKALQNNISINVIDNKREGMNAGVKKGFVTLSTIHKSKGLEWDIVFVIGMNDELFPAEKEMDKIEESRRLFYVATTRARKYLFYTFTPVNKSRKVTRFIGELPLSIINFVGFQREYLEISKEVHISKKDGVVEKIENLQIEDINFLRKQNIIPNITDLNIIDVHSAIELPKFIYEQNLLADFGIFLDCLVTRELAIKFGKRISNFSCQCCLANIHVEYFSYKLYSENRGKIEEILQNGKDKERLDVRLQQVIERIIKSAKKNGVSVMDVGVHPNTFLTREWREKLEKSYGVFRDRKNASKDIIMDIWNVSLCSQIVNNNRRKMLYINIPMQKVKEFGEGVLEMFRYFGGVLGEEGEVLIHKHYGVKGLSGEIDFWKDGALFDIKMSGEKKADLNWVMQLMCYKGLMDENCDQFYIYNALNGKIVEIPCVEEEKCRKLVEYLCVK